MSATEVEQQQQQEQPADESTAAEQFSKPAISPIRMQSADVNNENVAAETVAAASEQQQQPVFVGDSAAAAGSPPPEQPEQLDHLFRDARYFMIKSSNYENVSLAKAKGVWATPPPNEHRLNGAYHESRSVYLIFSVKESGRFQGYARLAGPSEKSSNRVNWVLPPGLSHRALSGTFRIDWLSRRELRFNKTGHLLNAWNEFKPVKIGRDGQEIEPGVGQALCRLFHLDPDCDLDRLVDRTKSRRRVNLPHHHQHHQQQQQHHQHYPPPMMAPHGQPLMPPNQQQLPYLQQPASLPPPPLPPSQSMDRPPRASSPPSTDRRRSPPGERRRHQQRHRSHRDSGSSSSRRRRRSSEGGGRRSRSRSRRSRSRPRRSRSPPKGGNGDIQGVGKETFINGSYQDYLRQFGSAVSNPADQASQQQPPSQQQMQYAAYGYQQYPAAANPYAAMMYGQAQYMMPGQQQPMYAYQQQQQFQVQQQVQQPQLSAEDYEKRVNEFLQRTTGAAPGAAAASAATATAAALSSSGGDSPSSSDDDGGRSSSSRSRRRRRRRSRSSSRR